MDYQVEQDLMDRAKNNKCMCCGEQLTDKEDGSWEYIEHKKFGVCGVHSKHIHN